MRIPPFELYARWLQAFGILIAGMVIGGAVYMSIYNYNYNYLLTENNTLRSQLNKLKDDYESLQANKDRLNIINSVTVHIEKASGTETLDKITENEISERVRKDLQIFRGKTVSSFAENYEVNRATINNKIYPFINDKHFRVELTMVMVISSELRVWVKVHELKVGSN